MASITRVPTDRQDCLHSKSPFDQGFHVISRRGDLSSDAKLVHAYLVSQHRSGESLTQVEIGEKIGLTRHEVWGAIHELVVAGLVESKRRLGRANEYTLLAIEPGDLAGTAPRARPVRQSVSGQSGNFARAGTYGPERRTVIEEPGYTGPKATASRVEAPQRDFGRCVRCPHREHPGYYCSRCLCSTRDT